MKSKNSSLIVEYRSSMYTRYEQLKSNRAPYSIEIPDEELR